jgi:hypothetical protein
VPGPQIVGVVALIGVSGGITEVVKIPFRSFGDVLVVAGRGRGAVLEATPDGIVALVEVFGGPVRVGVVAQG